MNIPSKPRPERHTRVGSTLAHSFKGFAIRSSCLRPPHLSYTTTTSVDTPDCCERPLPPRVQCPYLSPSSLTESDGHSNTFRSARSPVLDLEICFYHTAVAPEAILRDSRVLGRSSTLGVRISVVVRDHLDAYLWSQFLCLADVFSYFRIGSDVFSGLYRSWRPSDDHVRILKAAGLSCKDNFRLRFDKTGDHDDMGRMTGFPPCVMCSVVRFSYYDQRWSCRYPQVV